MMSGHLEVWQTLSIGKLVVEQTAGAEAEKF
jgi:hypothetical protein